MALDANSKEIVGEKDVVVQEVLRLLRYDHANILTLGADQTSRAKKGVMSLDIIATSGYIVKDAPTPANPSDYNAAMAPYSKDTLERKKSKTVETTIKEQDEDESTRSLIDDFNFESSEDIVDYISEVKLTGMIRAAGTILPSTAGAADTPNPNKFVALQDDGIVNQLVDIGTQMTIDKIKKKGRMILASPTLYGVMKKSSKFEADKSGNGVSALVSGQVGYLDGTLLVEWPSFNADEVAIVGKNFFAWAFWKRIERKHQYKMEIRSYLAAQDFNFECAALRDGALIYFGDDGV